MSLPINKILLGDCLNLLKDLPDNSIDCCVTDPPYGWKFMGKKWDCEIPPVAVWQEVLRVLKPGAHILVACGTRTQHRMAVNIEDAGFEIRDVISWHYGSGFPKSLDISKAIDKAAGVDRIVVAEGRKDKRINLGSDVNKSGNWKREGAIEYVHQTTSPLTDDAKQWSGWGTALKPATEFWTLARKPISERNIAANVIKHGTSGLNIDACRIEALDIDKFHSNWNRTQSEANKTGTITREGGDLASIDLAGYKPDGRFPANVILDEFMAEEMDHQSGLLTSGKPAGTDSAETKSRNTYGKFAGGRELTGYGDTGGASRFFYCAKASSEERAGVSHPTVKPQALIQYLLKLICLPRRVMIDPFAGSGSHCLAAMKLGIDFIGIEKDEKNWAEANKRLQKELGLFNT